MQASQVPAHQTEKKTQKPFLYGSRFVQRHSLVERGRDFPQTVTTSLEALYCLKYHYML